MIEKSILGPLELQKENSKKVEETEEEGGTKDDADAEEGGKKEEEDKSKTDPLNKIIGNTFARVLRNQTRRR